LEHVDAVVRGLAERSWPRLLRDYCAGTLQRVYEESPADPPVTIAVPDRRQIKRERYIANNTVEMSRGCTKRCDFCVTHELHADYLTKDVDQTLAEIRSFRGPLSGKLITFLDPNVIGNVPFARRFFTALTRLRKWWVGCVSIDLLRHEGLLDLLVASGAKGFLIGFESLDQQALDSVNKSFSVTEEYLAAIELFHRRGVMVQGSFVFGFDSDTPETFDKTVDFIIRAKIELPQFTIFTPFPGTAAFRRLDAAGRILHRDWSLYNGHNVVFQPQQLTPQQLQDGVRAVWERTYSLPNIVRRLAGPPYLPKIPALLSNLNFRRFMRRVHAGR